MEERKLTAGILKRFREELVRRERSAATVEKYMHDVRSLAVWLDGGAVTPERVLGWKKELTGRFKPGTVNGKLAAANALFAFAGWGDCRLESLKVQRRAFREDARELSREEFYRLVNAAGRLGKERLSLLLEAIAGTGIRVSEVKYLTVEAARQGVAEIALKGKIRTILLPGKLCRKLLQYARKQKTASGEIFLTRSGKPMNRKQIWAEMKALSK
ncbi:MAG TPA: tyrosine-type recombinase/integrase, partial [Candidatus Faecivivens stercoravium]|nr:tyrosine-type recombinase/integrase [Candidatus Faecivivens stercoravium]